MLTKILGKYFKGWENTYPGEVLFKRADGLGVESKPVQEASDFNVNDVIICKEVEGVKVFEGQAINTFTPNVTGAFADIAYADLVTKIANNELTKAATYRITDYRTVHEMYNNGSVIAGQTKTCDVEPLIVYAIDTNKLAPIAFSEQFPQDIIYYDVANNQTKVPGCTHGFIYRRIDTVRNIDIGMDWRNVTYRCFKVNVTAEWDSGTTYNRKTIVKETATNNLFVSLCDGNLNNALTDVNFWRPFEWDNLDYAAYVSGTWSVGGAGLSNTVKIDVPTSTEYEDKLMFPNATSLSDIHIKNTGVNVDIILSNNNVYFGTAIYGVNIITGQNSYNNRVKNYFANVCINIPDGVYYKNSFKDIYAVSVEGNSFTTNSGYELRDVKVNGKFEYNHFWQIKGCFLEGSIYRNAIGKNFTNITSMGVYSNISKCVINKENFRHNYFENVYLDSVDFGSATHVYGDYSCRIIKRVDGTHKLIYLDNSDDQQIVAVTA